MNGTVAVVLTDDNRPARLGEPLLRLDPRDFEGQLDGAKIAHFLTDGGTASPPPDGPHPAALIRVEFPRAAK